jgi:hypothetical protein
MNDIFKDSDKDMKDFYDDDVVSGLLGGIDTGGKGTIGM